MVFTSRKFNRYPAIVIFYYLFFGTFIETPPSSSLIFPLWVSSNVNQDGFKPNLETHLVPLLATKPENVSDESAEKTNASSSKDVHHQLLLQVHVPL